ncbi:MAG: hypothetical protein GWN84_07160 [Gammaproteobacteria bacterium]|nr:hypothetical protein [Gammaproteobacteria bacterium]NIR82665.1 hypothetical protein [Gammaproteobacteria bacterium]NIR89372.1 hypothetical protein [Gammaproteobacteria bacterium]NIU03813.1 hypothetical protein [Gammaproteobacteria bacterium]NIV51147.1 hypothetical protein [Gammaproteobacteria bacterium]
MPEQDHRTFAGNEAARAHLRDHFLRWQCRVRQQAVREQGGRPSPGMRPLVSLPEETQPLATITVLVVRGEPEEFTAQFRFIVRKSHDPAEHYENGLRVLAAEYYQYPQAFSDRMTALFAGGSSLARRLREATRCILDFEQANQRYTIPCAVAPLSSGLPAFEATYWHNSLFNPAIPPEVDVLSFAPDWSNAVARPPAP